MTLFTTYYKNLFLSNRLYGLLGCSVLLFLLSFFFSWLGQIPLLFFWAVLFLLLIDILLLHRADMGLFARRSSPDRLSNGDENTISVFLENSYSFNVRLGVLDEIPFQFQKRDVYFTTTLNPNQNKTVEYKLRPLKRGEYQFGHLHVFVSSPLGIIKRRFTFQEQKDIPVYPSFLQMKKYQLMAISNRLTELGIKKVRRLGHSLEFEQVKNYVPGDDYRTINWKASARRGETMVNSFTDEKGQHVYCVIDKSRAMKMPFEGLSLLDYAINASLVLSNIALQKEDRAGLITVSEKVGAVLPAERKGIQLNKIMEVLYKEKTRYMETNMEALYQCIRGTMKQRSLVILFTNFESQSALERQLPFLKKIARLHLLLVVFFENTELKKLAIAPAKDVEAIYIKTIAEKFAFEKKQMVLELARHGIQSILSAPEHLTVNAINKYLEIKARQAI